MSRACARVADSAAYHAGWYGLGINDGFAARVDTAKQAEGCRQFRDDFERGLIDDTTVYLIAPPFVEEFKRRTGAAAECREIDAVTVCVSSKSATLRH